MKKRTIGLTAGMILGAMVFGMTGTAFAAGTSLEDAKKTALAAAGVEESQVIFEKKFSSYDDGREIYEVDFFVPGKVKYDFDIDAATGRIIDQDQDLWDADDDFEYAALIESAVKGKAAAPAAATAPAAAPAAAADATEQQAKAAALKDAGFTEADVTFTKYRKDADDGIVKYEIEFWTKDGREFDYEFNAADGTLLERDADYDVNFDRDYDDNFDFDFDFDVDFDD